MLVPTEPRYAHCREFQCVLSLPCRSAVLHRREDPQVQVPDCGRLLQLLGLVPDPRKRRGVRHQVASVLAIATAAVLAGSCSVLAIGEWAAEAPQELLAALALSAAEHSTVATQRPRSVPTVRARHCVALVSPTGVADLGSGPSGAAQPLVTDAR